MIAAWTVALAVAASVTGFDHVIHEGRVIGSVTTPPACADCHAMRASGALAGAPGHAACFGACHGEAPRRPRARKPYPLADERRRLCAACHAAEDIERLTTGDAVHVRAAFPPYTIDPDYTLAMPHAMHATTPCRDCHVAPGATARPGPPHARCAGCHAQPGATAAPAMTACASCHRPAFGPAVGPTLARGALPVSALFDHTAHAAKQPAGERDDCMACHTAIAATDSESLPAPTMAMCATCHDGERAFSTTATRCRACHQPAPGVRPERRARTEFSHRRHAALEQDDARTCATCHRLDADGRTSAPGADHRPCAAGPCHADDFAARQPAICGSCHIGNEPWRALRWFPLPARPSEFGLAFSHERHPAVAEDCATCHVDAGARRPLARGHGACTGAGCHQPDAEPAPLRACEGCHQRSLAANAAARARPRWSVRARFRHDVHDAACSTCHTTRSDDGATGALPRPGKPRCASCHDGAAAFKMTGHACSRCHAK